MNAEGLMACTSSVKRLFSGRLASSRPRHKAEAWLSWTFSAGLVIPRLPRPALQMAVAIVGAGIMPANFYLHSALVHSRSATIASSHHFSSTLQPENWVANTQCNMLCLSQKNACMPCKSKLLHDEKASPRRSI